MAICLKRHSEEALDLWLIVNDEDRERMGIFDNVHNISWGKSGLLVAFKKMVKIAPPPVLRLAAFTWPPCASIKPFTMASPRPRPPVLVVPPRWKGSNRRDNCSG